MTVIELLDLQQKKNITNIGEKARNLQWLIRHGWRVPVTYVLPFPVHAAYQIDSATFQNQIGDVLQQKLKPGQAYAVRSSANLEDLEQHSYAGQFRTFLNVRGMDQILQAVQQTQEAVNSPTVQAYSQKAGQDLSELRLAVIVQEMIEPVISGVAFSKNPLTGLDEVIVEAVRGSGEQLVQEGQTPWRWVNKWGSWTAQSGSGEVDLQIIEQVVTETRKIAQEYGAPVDLEWVYDGKYIYWVQLRPITGLQAINIYSNRISRELFAGLIKPLIWSVNVPLVNSAWIELFTRLIGPNDLQPEELAKSFAYRAYFNMGMVGRIMTMMGLPKETLELMMGLEGGENRPSFRPTGRTFRLLPRMVAFAFRSLRMGPEIVPTLENIRGDYVRLLETPLEELDEEGIGERIERLYAINQKAARLNIIVPLLLSVYFALFRRQLTHIGVDAAEFDLTRGMKELESYDPKRYLSQLAAHFNRLDPAVQDTIATCTFDKFSQMPGLRAFQAEIADFLARFGYMSDRGNDFSTTPWRETPELVLQMIITEAHRLQENSPDTSNLHKQSHGIPGSNASAPKKEKLAWESLPINQFQRLRLRPVYERARRFHLYREAVGSTYSYGYGLFRVYFIELGRRFVKRNQILHPEDIFYLQWNEIKTLIQQLSQTSTELLGRVPAEIVTERKTDLLSSQDLQLPEIIYGDELPPVRKPDQIGSLLRGIPSSRGYYQGSVKVIQSVSEFNKLANGDVLVIPYSDVSWTPLFTRAGAVIAESGGILSHSSIVAREFNLPCVVSVPQACQLPDNTLVAVDGYKGEITLLSEL
jgi:pyruvate,water dikinase